MGDAHAQADRWALDPSHGIQNRQETDDRDSGTANAVPDETDDLVLTHSSSPSQKKQMYMLSR